MSEYIPRLREELVAAATREQAGARRGTRLPRATRLAPVLGGALVAAALVLAVLVIGPAIDENQDLSGAGTRSLHYGVDVPPGTDAAQAERRSAEILRERLATLGVERARVTVTAGGLRIDVPSAERASAEALTVPGRLAVYDWEAGVLDPEGGSQYEAVERAAAARGDGGPSTYWLVDDATRQVPAGPRWSPEGGAGERAVEVPGGVQVAEGRTATGAGWYALEGAELGNAHVAGVSPGRDPATDEPTVDLALTPQGETAFESLTRRLAQRGTDMAEPGDPMASVQHFAIVLDDRLLSQPFIDYRHVPDGLDGSLGMLITGDLSARRANEIAAILSSGPLPATLVPRP